MQIGILEPQGFSADALKSLGEIGHVSTWEGQPLAEFLAPLDALFIRLGHYIDAEFLAKAPRLRWLCSPTTGHTHIDEKALAQRGVRLISLKGEREFLETIRATPEHTFGLILSLLRNYRGAFEDTLATGWNRDRFRGEEVYGNRVGVIGLGRIGFRVASYCQAFGAQVFWCDPNDVPAQPEWTRMPDMASLIESSRIVVLAANYTAGAPPLLDKAAIAMLKGRYFINTARGELVDENALLEAIGRDELPGVATDVIADENAADNKLPQWRAAAQGRNLILTPHLGGATYTSMARTEIFIAERLALAAQGGTA